MNARPDEVPAKAIRVRGLDTLRFILASWVVFGHLGFLGLDIQPKAGLSQIARGLFANLFSGPAAVIVFFLISGFCIHFPYRSGKQIAPLPYYSRRYVRILLPMVGAIALGRLANTPLTLLNDSILWSLLCEEIYYAIYPALILLKNNIGWKALLVLSACVSVAVLAVDPRAGDYPSYGFSLNWLLGLPCWLMGCWLAENFERRPPASVTLSSIWTWRLGIWFLSSLTSVLRFHTPIGYPWTLNLFAVVALFWLEREIAFFSAHPPLSSLEWAGKWSYSLYLVHLPLATLSLSLLGGPARGPLRWLFQVTFTYVGCYLFYLLVEKPSHHLARRLSVLVGALQKKRLGISGGL